MEELKLQKCLPITEEQENDEDLEEDNLHHNRCYEIEKIFESHLFHMIIIGLITFDILIVAIELTCTLDVVVKQDDDKRLKFIERLQIVNLIIVSVFVIEIIIKMAVYQKRFFTCYEVFDAIVIAISFVFDLLHCLHITIYSALEFVILGRLWRVARIVNGTVYQVRVTNQKKFARLKSESEELKKEINMLKQQESKQVSLKKRLKNFSQSLKRQETAVSTTLRRPSSA